MRIAIICHKGVGGGFKRATYYHLYLQSKNHDVDLIIIPAASFSSKCWFYYHSAYGRVLKDYCYLMDLLGNQLEKRIRNGGYDAVIGVETRYSYVLTKNLNSIKIFSCQSLEADEHYFSGNYQLEEIHRLREMELEIMMKSDYVVFPWKTTEAYVRKYIFNGDNLVTLKSCCSPQTKTVSYFFPPSVVSIGNLKHYWSNKELLSRLTEISPYVIDIYGKHKPEREYGLNYKGFAKSLDILYDYQFGLNTVSKDPYRKSHFSSKILSYLAYGLPVLYPEWQKYPNELEGCIPYNEANFSEIIEKYSERDKWNEISEASARQGRELDWKITLKPLDKLLEK